MELNKPEQDLKRDLQGIMQMATIFRSIEERLLGHAGGCGTHSSGVRFQFNAQEATGSGVAKILVGSPPSWSARSRRRLNRPVRGIAATSSGEIAVIIKTH